MFRLGFYLTSVTWTVIGVIWLIWAFRSLRKLQETEVNIKSKSLNESTEHLFKILIFFFVFQLQKWRVINKVDIRKEKEEKFKYFYCF